MATQALLKTLSAYRSTWCTPDFLPDRTWSLQHDLEKCSTFEAFVRENPQCFERSHLTGHMTGSACVVNYALTKVLLTHHRKLNLWLQLGGHADGNPQLDDVAMTEAHEESGLNRLQFLAYENALFGGNPQVPLPFDLDDHVIPPNKRDPGHMHYDVRFLVTADENDVPVVTEESHDVRWFTIAEARQVTKELSMHRQFDKIEALRVHGILGTP